MEYRKVMVDMANMREGSRGKAGLVSHCETLRIITEDETRKVESLKNRIEVVKKDIEDRKKMVAELTSKLEEVRRAEVVESWRSLGSRGGAPSSVEVQSRLPGRLGHHFVPSSN